MPTPPTKQQAAYRWLKDQILEGRFRPGERLVIDRIAARRGLSIIPVREAIQLLQAERLVDVRPHAGAVVAPVTMENVEEVFTVLEGIEAVAVRRAAAARPAALEPKLAGLIGRMDAAEKAGDVEKWSALNMEFHLAISETTGMPWVEEITRSALVNWDRLRRHFFREGSPHRFDEAERDHHALLQALRQGDPDRAESIVRRHNQNALRHYTGQAPANDPGAKPQAKARSKKRKGG